MTLQIRQLYLSEMQGILFIQMFCRMRPSVLQLRTDVMQQRQQGGSGDAKDAENYSNLSLGSHHTAPSGRTHTAPATKDEVFLSNQIIFFTAFLSQFMRMILQSTFFNLLYK